jgi:hypothetical protein
MAKKCIEELRALCDEPALLTSGTVMRKRKKREASSFHKLLWCWVFLLTAAERWCRNKPAICHDEVTSQKTQ